MIHPKCINLWVLLVLKAVIFFVDELIGFRPGCIGSSSCAISLAENGRPTPTCKIFRRQPVAACQSRDVQPKAKETKYKCCIFSAAPRLRRHSSTGLTIVRPVSSFATFTNLISYAQQQIKASWIDFCKQIQGPTESKELDVKIGAARTKRNFVRCPRLGCSPVIGMDFIT